MDTLWRRQIGRELGEGQRLGAKKRGVDGGKYEVCDGRKL